MLPERFLYVDKNNKVLSDDESYGCNPSLLWKRASGGFVFDPISLKLLCHKGTILKEKRPGKWVCTFGGKANQSESPDETAIRELYEEYELKVDKRNIFYLGLFRSDIRSQFESIYLLLSSESKTNSLIKNTEIDEIAWISIETVLLNLNKSIEWYSYGHELFFLHKVLSAFGNSDLFKFTDKLYFNRVCSLLDSQKLSIGLGLGIVIEDKKIIF